MKVLAFDTLFLSTNNYRTAKLIEKRYFLNLKQ